MEIDKINEAIHKALSGNLVKVVSKEDEDFHKGKNQGETSIREVIYKTDIEDWHIKVITETDSYGDEMGVTGVKFVKPVVKQVTDFE